MEQKTHVSIAYVRLGTIISVFLGGTCESLQLLQVKKV